MGMCMPPPVFERMCLGTAWCRFAVSSVGRCCGIAAGLHLPQVCAGYAPGQHAQQFSFCTVDGQHCIRGHTRPRPVERSDGKVLRFDHAQVACGVFEQRLRHIQALKARSAATQGARDSCANANRRPCRLWPAQGPVLRSLWGNAPPCPCERLRRQLQTHAKAGCLPPGRRGRSLGTSLAARALGRARRPPLACPRARGSGDKRHRGA